VRSQLQQPLSQADDGRRSSQRKDVLERLGCSPADAPGNSTCWPSAETDVDQLMFM